jgi:hypothetical protein
MAPFEDAFDGAAGGRLDVRDARQRHESRGSARRAADAAVSRHVLRHVLNAGDMHDSATHVYQLAPTGQRAPTVRELRTLVQRICDPDTRLVAVRSARATARRRQLRQRRAGARLGAPLCAGARERRRGGRASCCRRTYSCRPSPDALAPEQPLGDRALYRIAYVESAPALAALLDAVPARIALSAELVRETVQQARAPTSGVPREVRKGVLCFAASQLITWLGRQHEPR